MKKVVFSFVLAFLLFIQVPNYIEYSISELDGFFNDHSSYMDIKSTGDIKNVKEFSDAVSEFSKKENAFVVTLGYSPQTDGNELTELYISGNNIPNFLKRKGLTDDALNKVYSGSSESLPMFAPDQKCVVKNFGQMEDKSLSRMYYVYPAEKGDAFYKYMTENYNMDFLAQDDMTYSRSTYIEQIPGVVLMMIALLVFFAFWVVTQYQLNAVKKLHGYSDRENVLSMFGQFVLVCLEALACCFGLQFIFCGFYNRWESYFNLVLDTLRIFVPVTAVLVVAGLICSVVFYSSDVKYALKGRRPYKVLNGCAVALKVITIVFLCTSVVNIGKGMDKTADILAQNKDFAKVKDCRVASIRLATGTGEYMTNFEKSAGKFYKSLGGILIDNRNIVYDINAPFSIDDVRGRTVYINKNYLDINPIYDTDGKQIKIDENKIEDNKLIVLVPEKYKSHEETVYQQFYDWYKSAKYMSIPITELPEEQRTVSVELMYVKDNQNYFAFDTEENYLPYNNITDPFAAIYTKENMDYSYYATKIINGKYLLFENENQTMEDIYRIADETGVSEALVNVPTVNSAIDVLMNQCQNKIILSAVFFILTLLIVLLISIYIVKNYMEENKKLFFVKKMLGYPMSGIYGKFIIVSILAQFVVFTALKFILRMSLTVWLPITVGFSVLDFIIMWITAVKYQRTLTKSVLKGEEL